MRYPNRTTLVIKGKMPLQDIKEVPGGWAIPQVRTFKTLEAAQAYYDFLKQERDKYLKI
jgi:hypothetical protein